jgi:hypothetical protein
MNTFFAIAALLVAQAKPLTPAEIQEKVYKTLTAAGPAIDSCTEAYSNEFPTEVGKVELAVTVVKDGTVGPVVVNTALNGARNLRLCLEYAAKKWKFPPINTEAEKLSLTIAVRKGLKFALPKPGEKKADAPVGQKQEDTGFVSFTPSGWSTGN